MKTLMMSLGLADRVCSRGREIKQAQASEEGQNCCCQSGLTDFVRKRP
jgi:hypothetical protein